MLIFLSCIFQSPPPLFLMSCQFKVFLRHSLNWTHPVTVYIKRPYTPVKMQGFYNGEKDQDTLTLKLILY